MVQGSEIWDICCMGIYSVPGWAPKGEYAQWYGARMNANGNKTKEYHEKVWEKNFTYDQFVPMLHGF